MKVNRKNKDLISGLPDDILSSILSLLTLKDAVRMSTLSSRWRYLWVSRSNFNFNFDLPNVFGRGKEGYDINVANPKHLDQERKRFVRVVDHFMEFYKGTKIDSFRVSFYLDLKFASSIDQWINSVLASGVKELTLLFSNCFYSRHRIKLPREKCYCFPYWLLSQHNNSISKLCLEACILRLPIDCPGFSKLRVLSLYDVFIGDAFTQFLFSSCLLLDDLSLSRCHGFFHLDVVGASLRLVSLKVHDCYDLVNLQICAKNLTSFEFTGDTAKISSIDAPLLAKVYCFPLDRSNGLPLALAQLAHLPQLEILILPYSPEEMLLPLTSSTSFRNLRQLELFVFNVVTDDLTCICSILRAFPLLQKLSLAMVGQWYCAYQKEIRELSGDSLVELKEVRLAGFVGNWYELEFVKYVLKHSVKLERLVIDPFLILYAGGDRRKWKPEPSWYHSGRELADKFLQKEVPARAKLDML